MPIAHSHGFKIAYEVVGDGPPLVLHPGMFQRGAFWTEAGYTAALAASHTVITVDPLGMGGSDGPPDPTAYSLPRRADYVTAVLDELGADRAAYWGYSLGALTGYAVALHAPERLTRLVAGAFDPLEGFGSVLGFFSLSADADPYAIMEQAATGDPRQAAVIEAAVPGALRANYEAFAYEPGVHAELEASGIPMLMYAGTADPWYEPMRIFSERSGTPFHALPGADHVAGWHNSADVLAAVQPFLAADLPA